MPKYPTATDVNLPEIPHTRPTGSLNASGWNELEIIVDAVQTKAILNDGVVPSEAAAERRSARPSIDNNNHDFLAWSKSFSGFCERTEQFCVERFQ